MTQRISERVMALYSDHRPGDLERACRALEQLLPIDDDRAVEVLVWLDFMTRTRIDRDLDEVRHSGWVGERFICRLAVADAAGAALPAGLEAELDPELEVAAARVHLGIDGISMQAAIYPEFWSASDQSAAVRALLAEATASTRPLGPVSPSPPPQPAPPP